MRSAAVWFSDPVTVCTELKNLDLVILESAEGKKMPLTDTKRI